MNNKLDLFKIENFKGQVLLNSSKVIEEIIPLGKFEILRTMDGNPITEIIPCSRFKHKYKIRTEDPPNMLTLNIGTPFKIYSNFYFRIPKDSEFCYEKVPDSIVNQNEYILFRPIFEMILTNYNCINNSQTQEYEWKLEFEE